MARIDTVIFDLDGTLVDTELAAAKAILGCFERWKLEVDPTDAKYITGRTWERAFEFLFGKYPIPVSREEGASQMIQSYRDSLKEHLTIVPGAAEAVRSLAAAYPLALVSGSHRQEIFYCLDHLGIRDRFQVVLGAEDYPNSKPAPDGYLKALQMLGRSAERTLIFEDSHPGIASGRAAGAWVVAISGTNHFNQDTSAAHHSITDLTQVTADWVKQLAPQLVMSPSRFNST